MLYYVVYARVESEAARGRDFPKLTAARGEISVDQISGFSSWEA